MADNTDNAANDTSLATLSKEELMQKLGEVELEKSQFWERILRMQADADNARRRVLIDVENAHKYGLERFVNELIPIIESLELCLTKTSEALLQAASAVIEGVELTLKMFYTAMEKFGVKQVNPVGEAFNSELHQAISLQQDTTVAPNTVLSVLQKGYTLNGRLLRPALVIVSKVD